MVDTDFCGRVKITYETYTTLSWIYMLVHRYIPMKNIIWLTMIYVGDSKKLILPSLGFIGGGGGAEQFSISGPFVSPAG